MHLYIQPQKNWIGYNIVISDREFAHIACKFT